MSVDPITCHILDTTRGRPASGVTCSIYYIGPSVTDKSDDKSYDLASTEPFAMNKTDQDGRIKDWVFNPNVNNSDIGINSSKWDKLVPGIYKIKFLTGKYFHELSDTSRTFFPFVEIIFTIDNPPDNHYHIPLLLANHSYTTYRGS
ncbi:hydroxyisourate hydrolase [Yamadazyma tenuis]|uniref:5-hydroxyisourate hydrolase n=1 Tax=Candida tenuis (strain ATCC 10573 / BCRC 21748 / CBS 615 / JCM 9827 / NBRC 10315 / NRRL Y-1498 / VKM Y-70) TaxID=590646 RepID=G3B1B2_CANTC|nr:Hydroxyisourate hydrolase [Yamadazyma tenuis ATCC 10573]EGV64930.1 Hydroxyisourate hydrolase [Yamadazyma tenuis ATCC 10573]WEJ97725.1 hydroxyisourate hydrolase [Yamadazyma tenuis]